MVYHDYHNLYWLVIWTEPGHQCNGNLIYWEKFEENIRSNLKVCFADVIFIDNMLKGFLTDFLGLAEINF